jgi:uncharacterized membrane protein
MAGGEVSSSELLFTASLFAGMLLIISPLIHNKFLNKEPADWHKPTLAIVDWAPFILAFTAWAIDFIAFMTLDFSHGRVVEILAADASILTRVNGALTGWLSLAIAFILGFGFYLGFVLTSLHKLSTFELSEMDQADYSRLAHNLRRWGGWLWILMLYGLLPNDPFPLADGVSTGGIEFGGMGSTLAMWLAMVMFGLMTGVGVLQLSLFMERADRFHGSDYFPNIIGWLLTIPLASLLVILFLQGTSAEIDPLGMLLLDPIFSLRISFLFALSLIFLYGATGLRAHIISEQRLRVGSKRWKGLAASIGHHVIIVWVSTIFLVRQLPNVGNLTGAVWLGTLLVIPGFIAALLGMLLPVAGFDDRPRPELWGFRILQGLALPFIVAWMPLAVLTAPGILIGVSTAALIAPLNEDNPRVRPQFRRDAKRTVFAIDTVLLLLIISPPATIGLVLAFTFAAIASTLPLKMVKRVRPT